MNTKRSQLSEIPAITGRPSRITSTRDLVPSKLSGTILKLLTPILLASGCDKLDLSSDDKLVVPPDVTSDVDVSGKSDSSIVPNNCPPQPPLIAEYQMLVRDHLNKCTACHSSTGIAKNAWRGHDSENGKLSELQGDFDSFLAVAVKTEMKGPNDEPFVAAYPTGKIQKAFPDGTVQKHGGGVQTLSPEDIAALTQFVDHVTHVPVSQGETMTSSSSLTAVADCNEGGQLTEEEFFKDVGMLDSHGIVVKFLRDITGGALPQNIIDIKNRDQLKDILRQITYQRGFYDWLKWRFNDRTLTRAYKSGNDGKNLMGNKYGVPWAAFDNAEVADGPGNLLAFIVRDGKPVTDLVNARYFVVPGVKPPGDGSNENWVARLKAYSTNSEPLNGVVTDPLWLAQFPTTDTNIGRHRAEYVLRNFAHIRVLDKASRVVQAPANAVLPEVTYAPCAQCHTDTPLDSVAASFWDFQTKDGYKHNPKLSPKFLSINFGGQSIPKDSNDRLGQMMYLISKDQGFARSMADLAFSMLTNREPMKHPEAGEEHYEEHMRHFEVEDAFLNSMGTYLVDHGYNFRELVIEMAVSRWFAASGRMASKPSPSRKEELKHLGPNMAPPEVLAMRLDQMFDDPVFSAKLSHMITGTFVTELGGIDSKDVKVRSKAPNAPNELVRDFLAFEVDKLVVRELAKPAQQRYLLRDLDFTSLEPPVYPVDNAPIANNEIKYRNTLVTIYKLALGKYLDPNSPEITVEYNKWIVLWKVALQDLGSGKIASSHRVEGSSPDDSQGLVRTWGAYIATIVQGDEFGKY